MQPPRESSADWVWWSHRTQEWRTIGDSTPEPDCETDCIERCQGPCGVSHLVDPEEATDA